MHSLGYFLSVQKTSYEALFPVTRNEFACILADFQILRKDSQLASLSTLLDGVARQRDSKALIEQTWAAKEDVLTNCFYTYQTKGDIAIKANAKAKKYWRVLEKPNRRNIGPKIMAGNVTLWFIGRIEVILEGHVTSSPFYIFDILELIIQFGLSIKSFSKLHVV